MKLRTMKGPITTEALADLISSGQGSLVHLYGHENVLHPRGPMEKESVGAYLLERLKGCYDSWTDPEYGDNPPVEELLDTLKDNLLNEALKAFDELLAYAALKEENEDNAK